MLYINGLGVQKPNIFGWDKILNSFLVIQETILRQALRAQI